MSLDWPNHSVYFASPSFGQIIIAFATDSLSMAVWAFLVLAPDHMEKARRCPTLNASRIFVSQNKITSFTTFLSAGYPGNGNTRDIEGASLLGIFNPRIHCQPSPSNCLFRRFFIAKFPQFLFEIRNQVWRTWPATRRKACKMRPYICQIMVSPISQHSRQFMNRLHNVVDHLDRRSLSKCLIAAEDARP
jgi:hypothetical protein